MSDQQPTNPKPDEPEISGGWSQPRKPGGWRSPESTTAPTPPGNGGWEVVPAMPRELDVEPVNEGTWHLPKAEDTLFKPDDQLEILPRPESMDFPSLLGEASPSPADDPADDDPDSFSGLGELVALVNLVEKPAEPRITLKAEDTPPEELSPADMIEAALASVTEKPEDAADVLDFGDRTAAEREALSQAAGRVPYVPLTGLTDIDEAETDEAEDEADPLDSEDYIQRQIRQLEDSQQLEATEVLDATGPTDDNDPLSYAQQQLAELGLSAAQPAAAEPAEPLDPEREALAQKFIETEAQVRGLRLRHQSGQMSRDEFQTELRKLLILDDQDRWWMMGVDSDIWFRYERDDNQWVEDTPPRPTPRTSRDQVATETSGLNPVEVLGGTQMPYLPDDSRAPTLEMDEVGEDGEFRRVPRPTPINDPERTVPTASAVNMDEFRPSDAATLQGMEATLAGATLQHGAYTSADEADVPPTDFDDLDSAGETYREAVEVQRRSTMRQLLLIGSLIITGLFVLGTIFVIYILVSYNNLASEYRQQVADLANYRPDFQTARILDANGIELAQLTNQDGGDRKPLNSLAQISPEMIYAVLAVEDARYFENPGYDPIAIFRAFVQNIGAGQVVSGASTITQQIASLLILQDTSPTADNKLREIVIASEIAQRYSKNEILLLYLNEIPFGNQSFGVEAAAEFYFQKPAAELNLTESAMLSALIGAPSARNPVTNRELAFAQTDNALRQIAEVPCLNFAEVPGVNREYCIDRSTILNAQGNFAGRTLVERAEVQARDYLPRQTQIEHPHFVFFILSELERQFSSTDIYRRGFVVRTTLNSEIQDLAQQALRDQLRTISANGANNGAIMVTDPNTGAILAMVGSADFNNPEIAGQNNNVFAFNQPGSTIKPILYAKGLDGVGDRNNNGQTDFNEYLTAASILWDVPSQYTNPAYNPVNFDGLYRGPVSVRRALGNSLNVPAVKAFDFIGGEGFVEISRRLGLTFEGDARGEPPVIGRPSAVGATDVRLYDMMQAYGIFAASGNYARLYAIESVTDSDGNPIVLTERQAPQRVLRPQVAFLIQNILADDTIRAESFGANSLLNVEGYPGLVGAKTGTTNDIRDLWTIGFSRNLVTGVWIGRADNAPMRNLTSLPTAGQVWNRVMRGALDRRPRPQGFQNPGDIVPQTICDLTGSLPGANCPSRRNELFIASQPPPGAEQSLVINIPIDTWTFQRANTICPEHVEQRTFVNISDPFALNWLATTGRQTATLLGLPQEIRQPPAEECNLNTILPNARIVFPADGQEISGVIQITGQASASNFARYQLEYAPITNQNNFVPITGAITEQRPTNGSVLGDWDTRNVPNGDYVVRLAMFSTQQANGGYLYKPVRVRVNNVLPTATPTPTVPTPTPAPILPTETTVPFFPTDTPFVLPTADTLGAGGGGLFVTPTPEFQAQTAPGQPTPIINLGG